NHILLRDDWLKHAFNFVLEKFPTYTGRRLYNLVFEQWIHSNLKDSCYSILESVDAKARKFDVHQPLVLQITRLVDIGSSLLSQFNKLTYEFVDNSGFDIDPNDQKEDNLYQAKPSRCMMLTLSDGEIELKAMERQHISSLSLLTAPGCKILLHPPLVCRKGVFLLTPNNTQVLGGDDPDLMETGRPLNVMSIILDKEIPKKKDFSHIYTKEDEMIEEEQLIREFEEMEEQFDHTDFEMLPSTRVSPLISRTAPTPRPPQRSIGSISLVPTSPMNDTQTTTSTMSTLHIMMNNVHYGFRSTPLMEGKMKEEKVEVIDIDDDFIPPTSSALNEDKREEMDDSIDETDPFVMGYRSLRLITLEEAMKQSKFQTGGSKRKIEAFVHSFVEALRIVENLWTMKIQLRDESMEGVECIIHSSVLEKLIGLTVEEALTIRTSSDVVRKREGASRLAATEDILSRLVLLSTLIVSIQSVSLPSVPLDVFTQICPKARLSVLQQVLSSGGTPMEAQLDPLNDPLVQQWMQGQQMGINPLAYGSQLGINPYGLNNFGIQSFPRFAPQMNPSLSQFGILQLGYGNQQGYSNQLGYGNQLGYNNQLMGTQINPSVLGYGGSQLYGNSLYGQQGYGSRGLYPYNIRMPFHAEKKT
ncbi:hypothetical protein PMAYCL1PPCAC_29526, partial [Pristionchus mayeri]